MKKVISEPRDHVAPTAPIVETITIDQDRIGELIGPSGKNIKDIIARADAYAKSPVDININDDGKVVITAASREQMDFVQKTIGEMFEEAEEGKEYTGYVDKVMPYGVFVNVTNSISGLCHVSEIFNERVNADMEKIFKVGDIVKVRVLKIEDGRLNFTMKGIEQSDEIQQKIDNPPIAPAQSQDGGRFNRDRDNSHGNGGRRFERKSRF